MWATLKVVRWREALELLRAKHEAEVIMHLSRESLDGGEDMRGRPACRRTSSAADTICSVQASSTGSCNCCA